MAKAGSKRGPLVTEEQVGHTSWNDWRWQVEHGATTPQELARWFPRLVSDPAGLAAVVHRYPLAVTPYYAGLVEPPDPTDPRDPPDPPDPPDPIWRQLAPLPIEVEPRVARAVDALDEDRHTPVPRLIRRYRDRAVLLASARCAVYCRHCTRKRFAGRGAAALGEGALARAVDYLSSHPEIREVLVSGGDPLLLEDRQLLAILRAVRAVRTVEVIRLATRAPVVLPMRITDELVGELARVGPLYVCTQLNHPREVTPSAVAAFDRLHLAGIPVLNQAVLLAGVNDDRRTIEELMRRLVRNRIRPYYLFQCDLGEGIEHFRTPVQVGVEIIEELRARVSGLCVPHLVVDMGGGHGKLPLEGSRVTRRGEKGVIVRGFDGEEVEYPEPVG